MTVVGYSTLEVVPSMKGLRAQLEKQSSSDFAAAGKSGGKKFGDSAGREASEGFKSRMSSSLKGFNPLAGLAVGAGAFTLFKSAISEASEAEQAIGGVNAVFGKYAEQVEAASGRAADALGLSSTAYQQLVTVSGALLKNKGIEDFAAQSQSLVEVGADLAAMFGGSTLDAVQALNAALRGESDPIERYAISLNEAAINAKLAASGADKLTGAALDQAKTQARLALIMEQSADAQGSFARESNTFAGQSQRLTADLAEMRRELGEELIPAASAFVSVARNEVVPALGEAGGLAKDAAVAFASLPEPVLAGAAAFGALKIAAATGLGTTMAAGAASVASSMEGLSIRTMLAADAYRAKRAASITLTGSMAGVSMGAGRVSAAMAAVRASTIGAATAMRGFGASAVAALGGPFGIALVGATVALTAFMSRQKETKLEISGLTESLNKQTGALTDNTRAIIAQALENEGALKAAQSLGLSLSTVTDAALGNTDALGQLAAARAELDRRFRAGTLDPSEFRTLTGTFDALSGQIDAVAGETAKSREEALRLAEANRGGGAAAKGAADSFRDYGAELKNARSALQKLIEKEDERALKAIQQRRDQIALRETFRAARQEAREGNRVLFDGSKAADANMSALLDLSNQWATSTPKVLNARGAYENMRRKFIEVATAMGGGSDSAAARAKQLADELLKVPKTAPLKFQSEGFRERMAEIRALRREAARSFQFSVAYVNSKLPEGRTLASYATGGKIGGVGTGTSDSNLALVSRGEWMIRERAASYYGDDFMRRLNAMQLPRFANGGPVAAAPARASGGGVTITGGITVYADTWEDILRKSSAKVGQSMSDNVRFGGVR